MTYIRIDRVALMASPARLGDAESSVRAFLAARPTLTVDPKGQAESSPAEMEEVRLNVAAAISDLDWIDGYRRGLLDAERASRGEALAGPGVTPDPYDGWSPRPQRTDAYEAGLLGANSTSEDHPVYGPLAKLIDAWCERRDLGPLAAILPSYRYNNGLTDGWADLMDALRSLRGARNLPHIEQAEVERLVMLVERMVYRT